MTAHILVVDDEPDVEALVLQKFRHKIRDGAISFLFARDGVEALAALKANGQIDLVVTDINMPRMDGLSLLQKLQQSEEKVSTIIVSAYGDMSNIRTAMNRGAFDFVTKRSISRTWRPLSPKPSGTSNYCGTRVSVR
jgi:adenylate cyclase